MCSGENPGKTKTKRKKGKKMKNIEIFKKGEKIHTTGRGSRCFAKIISDSDLALLKLAVRYGYARFGNDAPRGGRTGDYYAITRTFTPCDIALAVESRAKDKIARILALPAMAPNAKYTTLSDIGAFVVNGETLVNFKGDGENAVEIYNVSLDAWKGACAICKEQITGEDCIVRKFEKPQVLTIAKYDCAPDGEMITIDDAVGFAVVFGKIKVFKV